MSSAISGFGDSHALSSPSNKINYDTMDPESNGDDSTATAKRTKVGLRPSTKESDRCSEIDLVSPPKQGLPQNEERDVGDPSEEIKQSGCYTNGHRATAPQTSSIFHSSLDVYHKPSAAEPDFGVLDENSVRVIVPQQEPEMVVPRGPGRPSSAYRNANKTVGSGPDIPQQQSSPSKKAFDFFKDQNRQPSVDRGTEQAAKRRKIMPLSESPDEDGRLYEETRDKTASSRSTKIAGNDITPLERKNPRQTFDVSEFRKVETIVSGSRRRRPDGQPSSNQSSRETTIIEEDDIIDSGPEVPKPPEPYRGTARTKEEIEARRRIAGSKSKYFTEPSSKSNTSGLGGATRSNVNETNGSRQAGLQNGRRRMSFDSISDDELSMAKPEPSLKKIGTGNIMRNFARSPGSASISRAGDIQSSLSRPNQRKTVGRPRKLGSEECPRFPVKYMRSALHLFTFLKGDETCYLQYSPKTSWMDVMMGDSNVSGDIQYSSFTFNATSATKMKYNTDDKMVALWVTESNTMTGSLPKLLVRADNGETVYRFVTFVQSKSQAVALEVDGDTINRIFSHTTKKYEEWGRLSEADDLKLLRQKRNRHHQAGDASPTKGEKRSADFDSSMQPPRPKKLHQRLQNGSSDNESRNPEGSPIAGQRSIEQVSGDGPRRRQLGPNESDNDSRPTTRSTRGENRAIRIRSPSPPRFTREHRDWQKFWQGDEPLIFPLEGTNKALVDKRDIERLDEGEYLNDNLITFYLRFLQDRCEIQRPEVSKRVFFMNTFFYPRLTSGKGRKNINYDAVKRWTSKVNIFDYDYIVVPVNENTHWYVAIICNVPKLLLPPEERISRDDKQVDDKGIVDLEEAANTADSVQPTAEQKEGSVTPEVARKVSKLSIDDGDSLDQESNGAKHIDVERLNPGTPSHISTADEDTDHPQKVASSAVKGRKGKRKSIPPVRKYNTEEPRIITLDSLAMTHSPTCSNLRDFLVAEAKEKLGVEITLTQPSIGMTAKNIPEQNNLWDCGLFLLGYIEGFLDHPDETIHGILQGKTDMASSFPKMNAPEMRINIRELIFKLRRDQIAKEHAAKAARRAAKQVGKAKEEQQTSESKITSSTSTSPKPAVPPKLEVKATEESGSASETKETPKPLEEMPSPPEQPTSVGETEEVPKTPQEAVNVIEEETPYKESPSTLQESATLIDCMDDLAGFKADEAKDEKATVASPSITSPSLEYFPEKAGHGQIRDKIQTPPRSTRTTSSAKTSPAATRAFSKMKVEGLKPKHPSPDRNRHRREAVVAPSNTLRPQPRQQLRSSPRNQIDIPSSSSEDSLRVGMSPSILKHKAAPRNTDEIPDSQAHGAERDGLRKVDRAKSVDLTEMTPMTRAGEAALRREKEMVLKQKKKSGAGGLFGGQREKGRRKDPVEIQDKE